MRKNNVPVPFLVNSKSIQAEAYQRVQVNIDYAGVDKKIKRIGVISANQNEGKSTTAANLAKLYSLKGKKVLLIDLDLRKPTIHRIFNVTNAKGITDVCLGSVNLEEVIHHDHGLDIVTSGSETSFPTNVLQSERLRQMINSAEEKYDYIIIDSPPILVVADGIIISSLVDGFLDVVVSGHTKRNSIKETLAIFKKNNMNLIGVVLTRVKLNRREYEGYQYYSE